MVAITPVAQFIQPPPTKLNAPEPVLNDPATTVEQAPDAKLRVPPDIVEVFPLPQL
jgi:hypothetical protein